MRRSPRIGMAVLFLLLGAAKVRAEMRTTDVTLKSGDEEIKAFLAEPEGDGPFPGVVVIQEWWGLNDWIKENAKRLAGQGYVALAPDLYHGKVTDDPKVAGQLSRGLSHDRALQDLKASVDKLTSMANVKKARLGTIGWCMGGGFALQLALHDERIKACTICYGRVVTNPPCAAAVLRQRRRAPLRPSW